MNEWDYNRTELRYMNSSASLTSGVDVYNCPHCGAEHRVFHGVAPILPFCFSCKKKVKTPKKE